MTIEYKVKGITLDVTDLCRIHEYYEAACIAEHLLENYSQITSETQALSIGYDVRRLMDKYSYDEEDAIEEVLKTEYEYE